eukprot:COSAG02_NODE_9022_length_2358_cov_0.951306_4_plen_319_part_01
MRRARRASEELFSPAALGGHQIFGKASLAVNGDLIVEEPPVAELGEEPADAVTQGMAMGMAALGKGAALVGAIAGTGARDPPRTASARTQFVQAYEEKVWKPVRQYRTDMEVLSSKRQQRNSMRLDYDAAYRTASGYAKKPPKDLTKKQRADAQLETSGVLFNMVNQEVTSRMKFFVDGRVKFWSTILKSVLECEVLSGVGTNKAIVPCIKEFASWIENGVPPPDLGPSVASAAGESLGLPPATVPMFPDGPSGAAAPVFGAPPAAPAPAPIMAPGSAPAAFGAAPAAFGAAPAAPAPAPIMAPGAPASQPVNDDPWGT